MYPWNVDKVHTNTQYLLGELGRDRIVRGSEVPGKQCLWNWEMERITVDDCSLVDGSSDLKENTFSLEESVIGTQTDSQTSTSFASSKIVRLQMSSKHIDKELANEQNKQFDPGGKKRKLSL